MTSQNNAIEGFTPRQVAVVLLIARGYTNAEAGRALEISARTVKAHSDVLRQKLGVRRRREIPRAFFTLTGTNPYPRLTNGGGE